MRNIKLLALTFITALSTSIWAQKTYTFDDGVALATDWTVADNTSSVGGTAKCEIASPGKFSAKNGNYILFSFENKSGISISITSTASFSNISNITFDAVANDNSKPNFTLDIVDDSGNVVKNIYSNKTSKTDFNTGGTNKWGVSNSDISPVVSGHIKLTLTASSSGKYAAIDNLAVTYQAGPPPASTDATLKSLTYNGTSVPGFSADELNYEVELPYGTTQVPTVAGEANDAKADVQVQNATSLPGATTVTVTAEDGTTTKTYKITFTIASAAPKVLRAAWAGIQGTATVDNVNLTITGKVMNGTSLTAIEPTFTGNNIATWTPKGAQDFSKGAVTYDFTSPTSEMTSYKVTITEAPAVSTDATLKSLTYGGKSVPNFSPNTLSYNIELTAGIKTPPTIAATPNDSKATMQITQASSVPGVGKVEVTAEDGTTKLTYMVNYTVQVPPSGLTTHVPEIYEAKDIAGGYNTPLTVVGGREYEVFYINRDNNSNLTVATSSADKAGNICDDSGTSNTARTKDGWLTISCNGTGGDTNAGAKDEFQASIRSAKFNSSSHVMEMHIQGYDQFSFYGNDNNQNPDKGKMFEIYIDGVKQTRTPQAYSINRFDISSGEHVIRLSAIGGSDSKLCSFSLRVSQEPRTKYLKGNDSTQVVLQTTAIKPITYVTKYNNIPGAMTRLVWLGQQATDIDLQNVPGDITDTLLVSGIANCPVGIYNYEVRAYYNGQMTNSVAGSFKVASDIQATSDIRVKVYQGEEMDQITFKYYALSADEVHLKWTGTTPTGISGSGNNGKYIIGGTPQTTGDFPFEVSITGADTTIKGMITVEHLDYGDNSVLYLYKNNMSYEQDAVYNHIKDGGKWNLIARKAKEDGLRPASQYANYKWVIISEDVDANNVEVMAVIRGGANLPVLNLQGFTYSSDRLSWGEPDNGAIDSTATKKKGTYLHVQHAKHPIYTEKMNYLKDGDSIQILSDYKTKGIMPINVDFPESYCLGTAYTRDIENYFGAGELQTALHEIPAKLRGGYKYICLPIAGQVTLANMGKSLIDGIVTYLTSPNEAGIELPVLQINSFTIATYAGQINQANNTILLRMPMEEYDKLETAQPIIELADPNTHVTPSVEPSIDLRYAIYIPQTFVVTDYINRCAYDLTIELYDPQGIEEVYEAGMWVNVYDIYGHKVTTTNENIYTMELPQGMYIVVTESGQSIKILRQ